MVRLLALLASLALVTAAATPAQKVGLQQLNRDCQGMRIQQGDGASGGFVVLVKTGANNLVANVVVQKAQPNSDYSIRLIQLTSGGTDLDCSHIDGQVTTDSSGYGNANIQGPVKPGAVAAWVTLVNINNGNNYYTIPPKTF